MNDKITIKQIAVDIGIDRSTLLKAAKKHPDITVHYIKTPGCASPLAHLGQCDAELMMRIYTSPQAVDTSPGNFYIIQLVPDLLKNRIKLGYATNVSQRLSQHQTSAPTAVLIKSYQCNKSWETTAINCVMANCRHVRLGAESFDFDDVDMVIKIADKFFNLMNPAAQE